VFFLLYLITLLGSGPSFVSGVSWLACSDYNQENARFYNKTGCRGYPRNFWDYFRSVSGGFGLYVDPGYYVNLSPANFNESPCRNPRNSSSYSSEYPMATYNAGQKVCVLWPSLTHLSSICYGYTTNDFGVRIYRSGVNPTSDPTFNEFKNHEIGYLGTNVGYNGTGYQNCPNFCYNVEGSVCSGCFTLPTNFTEGVYTFLWLWQTCDVNCWFSTCFDVNIVANSGNYVQESFTHQSPDEYLALTKAGKPDIPTINPPPSKPTSTSSSSIVKPNVIIGLLALLWIMLSFSV
jgi:hypothetical protein